MKKSAIIFSAVACTCSLAAFGFMNWETSGPGNHVQEPEHGTFRPDENPLDVFKLAPDPEFIYDVNPRFAATITKEDLRNAQSISDLVPDKATEGMRSFCEVKIGVLTNDKDLIELGTSETLNPAQRRLLHSVQYSNNFYVKAVCKYDNARTGKEEDYDFVYYVSVVPEKQAQYKYGQEGLLYYLEEKSRHATQNIDINSLKPGKLKFTITREGELSNIRLESSSGRDELDKAMQEALRSIPQGWEPATNGKGEKVEQELVFSYGWLGC